MLPPFQAWRTRSATRVQKLIRSDLHQSSSGVHGQDHADVPLMRMCLFTTSRIACGYETRCSTAQSGREGAINSTATASAGTTSSWTANAVCDVF
jgi:hypothetical protein